VVSDQLSLVPWHFQTFDPYVDISLDIKAAQSVQEALQSLVKPENLDGE
jgi:hypothetical protein